MNGGPGYINIESNTNASIYNSVIIDSQDRIIVAGRTFVIDNQNNGFLARFNPNGTLDTTFNRTGFINADLPTDSLRYYSVALDSQGKIVVVGQDDNQDGLIARFLPNGVLDAESNWNLQNFREIAKINNTSMALLG